MLQIALQQVGSIPAGQPSSSRFNPCAPLPSFPKLVHSIATPFASHNGTDDFFGMNQKPISESPGSFPIQPGQSQLQVGANAYECVASGSSGGAMHLAPPPRRPQGEMHLAPPPKLPDEAVLRNVTTGIQIQGDQNTALSLQVQQLSPNACECNRIATAS